MLRLVKTCAMAAFVAALAVPAMAQTKWNLPAAYPADNPHSVNLIAFAKDVADATGGKLQIRRRCSRRRKSSARSQPGRRKWVRC